MRDRAGMAGRRNKVIRSLPLCKCVSLFVYPQTSPPFPSFQSIQKPPLATNVEDAVVRDTGEIIKLFHLFIYLNLIILLGETFFCVHS